MTKTPMEVPFINDGYYELLPLYDDCVAVWLWICLFPWCLFKSDLYLVLSIESKVKNWNLYGKQWDIGLQRAHPKSGYAKKQQAGAQGDVHKQP